MMLCSSHCSLLRVDFCVSVGAFGSEMSIKWLISTSIPISDVGRCTVYS